MYNPASSCLILDLQIVDPGPFGPSLGDLVECLAWAVFHSSKELPLVLVASLVGFGTLSSYLSVLELTIVRALVLGIVELTLTLSDAVAPVSFIHVSIAVCESTDSIFLALGEGAFIDAAV